MLPKRFRSVVTVARARFGELCVHRQLPLGTTLSCCPHMPLSPGTLREALKMIMLIFRLSLAISTNVPFINMQMRR